MKPVSSKRNSLRILFITGNFSLLRNFESTIRLLAERGHRIHIASDWLTPKQEEKVNRIGGERLLRHLAATVRGVTFGNVPVRPKDDWLDLAKSIRLGLDYLRFLRPEFDDAPALRSRAAHAASARMRQLVRLPLLRSKAGLRLLEWALRQLERALPTSAHVDDFLKKQAPDLVMLTPLVGLGSVQHDYVKSAKARGIRTMLCVTSWDHLTSKGLILDAPDRVVVWNDVQKREAIELHGVPADRVVVTGAQCYDHWFEHTPRTTHDEFCRKAGLEPGRPFFLYVCSSMFIAPKEAPFVVDILERLRHEGSPLIRVSGWLIRPHPQNYEQWQSVDLTPYGNASIWPRQGDNPIDSEGRSDYFDALYHSSAVIGINTSAMLEGGLIGKPVLTMLAPEFRNTQEGTLHFRYLTGINGGLVHVARTPAELQRYLEQSLQSTSMTEKSRRFTMAFIRPHGLDTPATAVFADAVESLCLLRPPARQRMPAWLKPVQGALLRIASRAVKARPGRELRWQRRLAKKANKRSAGAKDAKAAIREASATH